MSAPVVAVSSPNILRTRLRPLALAAMLLAGASLHAQAAAQAQASPAAVSYAIPAGPLAGALNRYAQQAGVSIVIDAAKVQGLQTAGLQGSHAIEDGFAALLRGRDVVGLLQVRHDGEKQPQHGPHHEAQDHHRNQDLDERECLPAFASGFRHPAGSPHF